MGRRPSLSPEAELELLAGLERRAAHETAIMGWLRANPWLELREDGRDYAPRIAAKIAREAGVPECMLPLRWRMGWLHRLQLEAFAPPAAE